ncbi:serine hydrolase domain-containing protein [Caulobacter sp. KR2-114]|uniref:serine hydrolase domain-containing protein n=1 Tax=Caulobacter sp. KR2-114 TaxID=3400912 RepID=UPI003C03C24F
MIRIDRPGDIPRADRSHWREAPFSRWSFSHTPQVLACAPVAPAAEPRPLPEAPADLAGFSVQAMDGQALDLAGWLTATATDAIVVLKDGRLVFEAYAEPCGPHQPHIFMSATKSVTGLILGLLAEAGTVDVAAPVETYVPEVANGPYAGVSLRWLTDMRSAVPYDEARLAAYAEASGWEPRGARADLAAFFAGLEGPPAAPPSPFTYLSGNTDLLGIAMERASGKTFAALVEALIWRPMGAADTAFITLDEAGAPRCTGCGTARDMARLGLLVLEDGVRDGRQILPAAWLEDMRQGGDREAWRTGQWAPAFEGRVTRYRSGWYVNDGPPGMIFAMGVHGQNLFVDRDAGLVVAKLSSQAQFFDFAADQLTHAGVAELRRRLG